MAHKSYVDCAVHLLNQATGETMLYTSVYGPSVDIDKMSFVEELNMVAGMVHVPWFMA